MKQFDENQVFSPDMFEPVNADKVLTDLKMDTKPVGYLMDAWRRFKRNKGSVVAAIIILIIAAFAIVAPFFSAYKVNEANGYYKQVRPKVASQDSTGSGFWDGTYSKDQNATDYIYFNGIAAAALDYNYDGNVKWSDVVDNQFNPIKKVKDNYSQDIYVSGELIREERYKLLIDSYYEVGFKQVEGLTWEEYNAILEWEKKTGKKVIYPMVDTANEYFAKTNLNIPQQNNFWYRHDNKNRPLDENGNVMTVEQVMRDGLVPNYAYNYTVNPDGDYVLKGSQYYEVEGLTDEELLTYLDKVSPYVTDTKGAYAYSEGEYVLASTLSPEETATNTVRYRLNYVDAKGEGEYVFYGDNYVSVSSLSSAELARGYARYVPTFTPDDSGKYVLVGGQYLTATESGMSLGEFASAQKYSPSYAYSADGEYVYFNKKYVKESSLGAEELATLVKYYNLQWKKDAQGYHIFDTSGNLVDISDMSEEEQLGLLHRFDKSLAMYKLAGAGGMNLTVRVLYYNYYEYINNKEPVFIFGADSQGYDILIRLAMGARLSLILAMAVAVINLVIGAIYGAIEGYYGGAVDMLMERFTDILAGIPTIVLVTLFRIHFVDPGKVSPLMGLILALTVTGWIGTAYSVRMQFYRFKGQEYILAARTLGAKDARLMFKHIFPNSLGTLITSSVLVIPGIIFTESSLAYLGIIDFNGTTMTSLGAMLANGNNAGINNFPHIIFFPALILSLLMICFNLFGNGLRDAFNPSLRGSEE